MKNDLQKLALPAFVGHAALLDLLEEKGIITEDEYKKYYDEARKVVINETFEQMKSELF